MKNTERLTKASLPAGEILHQESDQILKFAKLIEKYQSFAREIDWRDTIGIRDAAYDQACDLVDNESTPLTDHQAETLITVYVSAACNTIEVPKCETRYCPICQGVRIY